MNEATVMLEAEPTLDDFARVNEIAGCGCDCPPGTAGRGEHLREYGYENAELCRPCDARRIINQIGVFISKL